MEDQVKNEKGVVTLTKQSKDIILCFDKKYEREVMYYLYMEERECSFGEIVENCAEKITYNSPISKACNRLIKLGIIVGDGGKGRPGSKYKIVKDRYEYLIFLVNQLNQLK